MDWDTLVGIALIVWVGFVAWKCREQLAEHLLGVALIISYVAIGGVILAGVVLAFIYWPFGTTNTLLIIIAVLLYQIVGVLPDCAEGPAAILNTRVHS